MYKITITKNSEVLFHTDEMVDMEVALIILLGVRAYNHKDINLSINKFKDGRLDMDFRLSDLQ